MKKSKYRILYLILTQQLPHLVYVCLLHREGGDKKNASSSLDWSNSWIG